MEQKNDEIDLLELFSDLIVRFYHYVLRRYKLLLLAIVIGSFVGAGLYLKNTNKYTNTIVGTSYVVNPEVIVDIINSLQQINVSNKSAIQEMLRLNPDEAASLIMIKADTLKTITTIDQQKLTTIKVQVEYSNYFDIEGFAKNLCSYIDANSYILEELEMEKQKCSRLIEQYTLEIKKLDSLQKGILASTVANDNTNRTGLMLIGDKNPDFFHKDIIELEKEKQMELKKLERITGFSVIDKNNGAVIKEKPLIGTLVRSVAVSLALGLFISIILEFKLLVKSIEARNNRKTPVWGLKNDYRSTAAL